MFPTDPFELPGLGPTCYSLQSSVLTNLGHSLDFRDSKPVREAKECLVLKIGGSSDTLRVCFGFGLRLSHPRNFNGGSCCLSTRLWELGRFARLNFAFRADCYFSSLVLGIWERTLAFCGYSASRRSQSQTFYQNGSACACRDHSCCLACQTREQSLPSRSSYES